MSEIWGGRDPGVGRRVSPEASLQGRASTSPVLVRPSLHACLCPSQQVLSGHRPSWNMVHSEDLSGTEGLLEGPYLQVHWKDGA